MQRTEAGAAVAECEGLLSPMYDAGTADAVPQLPERCLSRKAGIVRCCLRNLRLNNAPETIESVPCEPLYS